jgi:preprotein translocase subunit SecD
MLLGGLAPVTLTLAGIAGFILSIGMAVDANILIFERVKEEIRAGKDITQAINDGFARAWSSIRDSNVSSLITTVILYTFGTPSIKGFAVTLGIGILISMFTAISITKTLMRIFLGSSILRHPWLFGVTSRKQEKIS